MVDFGAPPPREVRARPYVYQQAVLSSTIPIHASISVETTHSRVPQQQQNNAASQTAPPPPAAPRQPSQDPRLPTTTPSFLRHMARSATTAAAAGNAPIPTPDPRRQGFRAAGPTQNQPRAPTVHMLHPGGPHPFGRLPVSMAAQGGWTPVTLAGHMPPMVYMEVRSNNQSDEQQSGQSPTALGEFDDFLPCHSRHLSRSTRTEAARQRPTVASTTTATFSAGPGDPTRPGVPTAAVPASVDELMSEIFRQVIFHFDLLTAKILINFDVIRLRPLVWSVGKVEG